jgi:hypothetical protein
MRRRGRGVIVAVSLTAAVACASTSETEPLPLQESAVVVEDDVRANATVVGEYAVTEEDLRRLEEECGDAEAVPLEGGESCVTLMELRFSDCEPPFEFCVRVYDVENADAPFAGWAEVVEGDSGRSLCQEGPDGVCLRVGLSSEALTRVVEPGPTEPTTTDPTPTETTTTDTPSPTDSSSPASPTSTDEATSEATTQ